MRLSRLVPTICGLCAVLAVQFWLHDGGVLQREWERMPAQGSRAPAAFVRSIGKMWIGDPVKRLYVQQLEAVRKDWPVVEIQDAGHLS